MLLVLSSRNNEEDVWRVFENHPDMVLQKDDIVDWRINWESKPGHLKEMADSLNLSLSQFIFLDDDPAQCLRMNEELPEVMTLLLPANEKPFHYLLSTLGLLTVMMLRMRIEGEP